MRQTTCWICGVPAGTASRLCCACHDRHIAGDPEPELVPVAASDETEDVPVAELTPPKRSRNAARWAWNKRRGLATAVAAGAVAMLLVLGISFGWADATDRASELEHKVDAREQALHRAEKKLRRAQKAERKVTKSLGEQKAAKEFLETAYRGSQSQLQQTEGLVTAMQDQLRSSNLQVLAQQECLDGVIDSLDGRGGRAAVKGAVFTSC
ncbi:MAG: hypothetical protein ACRDWD_15875 [Acidimicrobiia bacterium]